MWILVVEDNPDIRESFAFLIEQRGYRVRAAADGEEALAKLAEHGPACLILLDLMMPRMDGWQLRERLLADPECASIPLVIVSSIADLEHEAERLAALHYLRKPIDLAELFDILDAHCAAARRT